MVDSELKAKEKRTKQKEADPETEEKKPKQTSFSDVYDGEWFVDAEEDEELADTILKKHGFGTLIVTPQALTFIPRDVVIS